MRFFTEFKSSPILLIIFPVLNLLFMHYFFYFNGVLEWTWMYSEVINFCNVVFDVSVLILIFLLISGRRIKISIAITQMVTLLWSFVNVFYGKFFFRYMSISAIGEANGLRDGIVMNSIMSEFCWSDIYYLISLVLFIIVYKKTCYIKVNYNTLFKLIFIPILSITTTFVTYSTYHFIHPHYRHNFELYKFRSKEFLYDSVRGGTPNLCHFQTGCIRVALFEIYDMLHVTKLTIEQRKMIEDNYRNHYSRTSHHVRNPRIKNVVFILLESFLSAPIDMKVDGKEITPFLNALKREPDVYYNGKMISDIGCGESGDGQFIYMTGLLPLKYKMTVGQVKDNVLPALPIVLKDNFGIKRSEIFFPTMPNLWQQADMNVAYGIDNAYSLEDIVGNSTKNIDDKNIFEFAAHKLDASKEPFFSLILSISTHSPYEKPVGKDLGINASFFSEEYCNYLSTCHFLDCQLKHYFNIMKLLGLYDKSLIIIASDHPAHLNMLNMDGLISNYTPLFIVNGNINNSVCWNGEFHQVDVYTTILDVLMINNDWLGLGYSLLNHSYRNSVNENVNNISESIIKGNYFFDVEK